MEPPFSPGPGADISTRPNPDADVARRRVTIILLCVLSLLVFLGGARLVARSHGNPEAFLVGLFLCLLGAPIPFLAGRSVCRTVLGFYRVNRGLCPGCGHSTAGLHKATCPECGTPVF